MVVRSPVQRSCFVNWEMRVEPAIGLLLLQAVHIFRYNRRGRTDTEGVRIPRYCEWHRLWTELSLIDTEHHLNRRSGFVFYDKLHVVCHIDEHRATLHIFKEVEKGTQNNDRIDQSSKCRVVVLP